MTIQTRTRAIREQLGMTQADFAYALGRTQQSVSNYERGAQDLPPDGAARMIHLAQERGLALSFDSIYILPPPPRRARNGKKNTARGR